MVSTSIPNDDGHRPYDAMPKSSRRTRHAWRTTGACGYNRPCAHQYVGKSQSCMVENDRLIPHASYTKQRRMHLLLARFGALDDSDSSRRLLFCVIDLQRRPAAMARNSTPRSVELSLHAHTLSLDFRALPQAADRPRKPGQLRVGARLAAC